MGNDLIAKIVLTMVPFLLAICTHEAAHAFAADRLGDPTARNAGRLTLNPLAHIDWIGTIALPLINIVSGGIFPFGWARPVPVNTNNLRNPKWGIFWVAAAGPLSNIVLMILSTIAFALIATKANFDAKIPALLFAQASIYTNLALAVFNLLPIPPLDGGNILGTLLPYNKRPILFWLQSYGFIIILFLAFSGAIHYLFYPFALMADTFRMFLMGVFA